MTRTVYLDGDRLPETEAKVSIVDRGYLFADAIDEATAVIGRRRIDDMATPHACNASWPSSTFPVPSIPRRCFVARRGQLHHRGECGHGAYLDLERKLGVPVPLERFATLHRAREPPRYRPLREHPHGGKGFHPR